MAPGNHERPEKILLAMFQLSEGTTRKLKYEDIVVRAFKMFPKEFALRGYPEYPDASDIHKPLYGPLKRKGLVQGAQKTFSLTPSGVQTAELLTDGTSQSVEQARGANRLTRDVQAELKRMLDSAAYRLYLERRQDRILDTDFFMFLGCSVRTPRNDFLGRLSSSQSAVLLAERTNYPTAEASTALASLWSLLTSKFRPLIDRRKETK